MMNMAKLGTVSRSLKTGASVANPLESRAGGLMRYTLCVFQEWASFALLQVFLPGIRCAAETAADRDGRIGMAP